MKKIILTSLLLFVLISCKNNTKPENTSVNKTKEIVDNNSQENTIKPKTIIEYIDFGDKTNAILLDDTIGDLISVKDVSLFTEEESKKTYISIKLSEELQENLNGNYRIIARMYPFSQDDLTQASKDRDIEFDSWYFDLKTHSADNENYIYGKVGEKGINSFKKVILQLISLKTNKIEPKNIVISNLETKEAKTQADAQGKKQKPKTILEYISFGNKSDAILVDDVIGDLISVKDVSLFREETSNKVYIAIKLRENLGENLEGKYRIIGRMYPYSPEDLTQSSRDRKLEFDSWYFDLKTHSSNADKYIYGQVAENGVDGFQKVKLQLINMETKEISPKSVIIENLEAE